MKQLDLRIVSDRDRQLVRRRRRRRLALALLFVPVASLAVWQGTAGPDGPAASLVPAALLDAMPFGPQGSRAASPGMTVAEYAARREALADRARPFGAPSLAEAEAPVREASLSPEERESLFSAPLLPR